MTARQRRDYADRMSKRFGGTLSLQQHDQLVKLVREYGPCSRTGAPQFTKCARKMGLGKKEEIKMIRNCYSRKKMRGRELWKLIETKWKWPKEVPGKKSKWRGVSWDAGRKMWQVDYHIKEVTYFV